MYGKKVENSGAIIPFVIVLILTISILIGVILMVGNFANLMRARETGRIQNYYLAEAGITRALYRCRTKDYTPRTERIENRAVEIRIDPQGGGNYLITSTVGQ